MNIKVLLFSLTSHGGAYSQGLLFQPDKQFFVYCNYCLGIVSNVTGLSMSRKAEGSGVVREGGMGGLRKGNYSQPPCMLLLWGLETLYTPYGSTVWGCRWKGLRGPLSYLISHMKAWPCIIYMYIFCQVKKIFSKSRVWTKDHLSKRPLHTRPYNIISWFVYCIRVAWPLERK